MTEKELIGNLKELRQIKPNKGWADFNKLSLFSEENNLQLLGQETTPSWSVFSTYVKPAFAGFFCLFMMFGTYVLVKNSIPGDVLYEAKKIAKGLQQAVFVPEEEKPVFQLRLANDRLEDLAIAPARNLAPTINEFQASISEAVENLAKINAATTSPMAVQKIVEETQKLTENTEKAKSLGMVIGDEGTDSLDKAIVGYLIEYLEGRTLTEEKVGILEAMKQLFDEGNYREAFELYLLNQ